MTELQRLARCLADDYQFECQGGPLRNCTEWRALCAAIDTLAVDPPPSGASPQAETLGDAVSALWRALCEGDGKHSEMLDRSIIATHLERYAAQKPAPVSPVEPESSSFEANTASNLLQKVELSTLDRYRNTNQMDVDTWMVRAVASSEPRSEDDLVLLDHVIALLKPTVEPEPCVWREDEDGIWETSCGASWVFTDGSPSENNTKFCHNCGHPVQPVAYVERFEDDEDEAGAPLKVER